jgi:hypothetical protein
MQATGVQLDLMPSLLPACYRLVEERSDVSLVIAIWRRGKAVDGLQRFRTISRAGGPNLAELEVG